MGWFLLYWFIGIIVLAIGWYKMNDSLTVGHLIACIFAALVWPLIAIIFTYVAFEDKVLIQKKKRNRYE